MALTAFYPTCQRTVYLEAEETAVCPVCSSPLLETVESPDEGEREDGARPARPSGGPSPAA